MWEDCNWTCLEVVAFCEVSVAMQRDLYHKPVEALLLLTNSKQGVPSCTMLELFLQLVAGSRY